MKLRDKSEVQNIRLDRLINFDERSRLFPVTASIPEDIPKSKTWACRTTLNQGREGACVGFGIAHELIASPAPASLAVVHGKYAKEVIYWEAQRTDQWDGGSYPGAVPRYEGTSVLAGVKVIQKLGWIENYEWSFGLNELILGIGHKGPAVLGLNWHDTMYKPDTKGFIWPSKGRKMGGHCIMCRGVNIDKQYFTLRNSWGRFWGKSGDCYITFTEMEKLLDAGGEAVFFIGRKAILA